MYVLEVNDSAFACFFDGCMQLKMCGVHAIEIPCELRGPPGPGRVPRAPPDVLRLAVPFGERVLDAADEAGLRVLDDALADEVRREADDGVRRQQQRADEPPARRKIEGAADARGAARPLGPQRALEVDPDVELALGPVPKSTAGLGRPD